MSEHPVHRQFEDYDQALARLRTERDEARARLKLFDETIGGATGDALLVELARLRRIEEAARAYLDDDSIIACAHSRIACNLCADKIANLRIAMRKAEEFR